MRIYIQYSVNKDAENYLNGVFEFKHLKHGRENIREDLLAKIDSVLRSKIEKSKNKEGAQKAISDFLIGWQIDNAQVIKSAIKNLEFEWNKNGKDIIKKLEALYQKQFPFDKITIYLTSLPLCPYSYKDKYMFVYIREPAEKQIKIILHELNHFMFYFYYPELKEKLGHEKYELLKESLSYFSNSEQKGKPNEKGLRDLYASKDWKNLDETIKSGADLLLDVKRF